MRFCRLCLIAGLVASAGLVALATYRLPWLAVVAVLVIGHRYNRRPRYLHAHGTARWADTDDLAHAGMLGDTGLAVGRMNLDRPRLWPAVKALFDRRVPDGEACHRFVDAIRRDFKATATVRLAKAVHTAVFAPTGAGKGVSLIIPFLRECLASLVMIDTKGEGYTLTAEYRRRMGQKVVVLAPFDAGGADTLNPLDAIRTDSPTALDDCRAIANQLVVRTGTEPDPIWNNGAENMITALIATTLFMSQDRRSLQTVRTLLTDAEKRDKALRLAVTGTEWNGMLSRLASQALNYKDKELAGVLSTANQHLTFLDTPAVADSTRTSTFDPADLLKKKMTVYLILPPQYLKSHSGLLRLWVGALMRACVTNGLQEENKCHFILDEAASLGKLDMLEDAVDKLRGYGVRCQFYYQSLGQLKQVWRDGLDQSLLSNTSQVFFGVNDKDTAEHVSTRLGEYTATAEGWGTNRGGSTSANTQDAGGQVGKCWGSDTNLSQIARRLLKPEEVTGLSQRTAITFTPGVPPVVTTLVPYFAPEAAAGRWERMKAGIRVWTVALTLAFAAGACVLAVLNSR